MKQMAISLSHTSHKHKQNAGNDFYSLGAEIIELLKYFIPVSGNK